MTALTPALPRLEEAQFSFGFQMPIPHTQRRDLPLHSVSSTSAVGIFQGCQVQPQYALPLRSTQLRSLKPSRNSTLSPTKIESENYLRRKTPGGTLTEAYDGTSVGSLDSQHTTKHLLLHAVSHASTQNSPSIVPVQANSYANGTDYRDFNQRNGHFTSRIPEAISVDQQAWLSPNAVSGRPFTLPADSALYQFQPQDVKYLDWRIPNMMQQPSFRPQLGPAVSNEHGPYGPYWPNGTFVPYRPAAFQHSNYHSMEPGYIPGPSSHVSMMSTMPDQAEFHDPRSHIWSHGPSTMQNHDSIVFQNAPPQLTPNNFELGRPSGNGFRNSVRHPYFNDLDTRGHRQIQARDGMQSHIMNEENNRISYDEKYPDRVLAWAHSVYTNLVISCRQARRANSTKGSTQGRSASSIYQTTTRPLDQQVPPPLRRHLSDPPYAQSNSSGTNENKTKSFDGRIYPANSQQYFLPVNQHFNQAVATSYEDPTINTHQHQRQPFQRMQSTPIQSGNNLSHYSSISQPPRSSLHSPHAGLNWETTPKSLGITNDALIAQQKLAELCSDSKWTWIEGMLLSGCLEYMLGNHSQAVQLYSRILERDANHVEALSNLAAALLALNRRAEAEKYWRLAVELRPSYFEAIEHLIGLLCYDNRNREAANIIDRVQHALRIEQLPSPEVSNPAPASFAERQGHKNSRTNTAGSKGEQKTEKGKINPSTYSPQSSVRVHGVQGFGSSGYAISGTENGRILALVHAKGNILYNMHDHAGAAKAFEESVLIAVGHLDGGIDELIKRVIQVFTPQTRYEGERQSSSDRFDQILLLPPEKALQTARLCFPGTSSLPGLRYIESKISNEAALSVTSNALLSLAKIFQDGMTASGSNSKTNKLTRGVQDILALYYLSLSLHASPSTANNVGILLATAPGAVRQDNQSTQVIPEIGAIPGVVPGSGVALALAYYKYGLRLDSRHAHLFTNLGSLLKDIGQLSMAIQMYEQAVACDGNFDIALANLANAVKDQGRIGDAITYYKRAVQASPNFSEAVCGLANALNSVCNWAGRGGIVVEGGAYDRWHVNDDGMLADARSPGAKSSGWMSRVVDIVDTQLAEGESWGQDCLSPNMIDSLIAPMCKTRHTSDYAKQITGSRKLVESWLNSGWRGARVVRLVERSIKMLGWQWYHDKYVNKENLPSTTYTRPVLPSGLSVPGAPTVLPFHTFTCPMSAKQIRMISQRNGLRVSCAVLRSSWLPTTVYPPPAPPAPYLKVGYVSSDFNNHPLAHLMQSVFGMHNPKRVKAFCYATTPSDRSIHRQQIEKEAPVFHDASSWAVEKLVNQIVYDGIHILVNLNGYTRGARNEVFAARPAPIQMSFMGFAGSLGAEWCDYLLADETAIPPSTLRPHRQSTQITDLAVDDNFNSSNADWVYSENIIYTRSTFFCCDHAQSASPDNDPAAERRLTYADEQQRRWAMRKQIFPQLPDDALILANFNQLYKIDPSTFRSWLRILARLPSAVLWLLRFPALGEPHLRAVAAAWAGAHVAARLVFTDVAAKPVHIARAAAADLFLDTPECNAHTTAADCLWSGTPLLTWGRYEWKMCSRMGGGILKGALEWSGSADTDTDANAAAGAAACRELTARSEAEYEERAVALGSGLVYAVGAADGVGRARGRLAELRRLLWEGRWTAKLFDTRRWVGDVEDGYEEAWRRWVAGEGGDIWLRDLPVGGHRASRK